MMSLHSEVEDLPHLDENKNPSLHNVAFQTLQWSEPKMFRKREENGFSTPHVLSMRPYAHTQAKHAKKDFLSKTCQITPLGA